MTKGELRLLKEKEEFKEILIAIKTPVISKKMKCTCLQGGSWWVYDMRFNCYNNCDKK